MTDIFDDNTPPPTPTAEAVVPPVVDQVPDHLKDLIGPGKKYATTEKALESLPHAQAHIAKLEQELAAERERAARGQSVDDVRKAVQELLAERVDQPVVLDEATLAPLVTSLLTKSEQQRAAQQNTDSFKATLAKAYGDKAKEKFGAVAAQHGMTPEQLSNLVRSAPSAALALFPETHGKPSGNPGLRSDLNTNALDNTRIPLPEKKSIMQGAPTSVIVEQWRRSGLKSKQDN